MVSSFGPGPFPAEAQVVVRPRGVDHAQGRANARPAGACRSGAPDAAAMGISTGGIQRSVGRLEKAWSQQGMGSSKTAMFLRCPVGDVAERAPP